MLCKRRDGRCPCLELVPDNLLGEVMDLIEEGQRNYALTLILRFWERIQACPLQVPELQSVRGTSFCCFCDSESHRCAPEMLIMGRV